ncbi:MAG: alanine/ornithine racemase family PLP-dependent enzyme [Defluviitaleaceae bacterium]|nr:alanine/ornithine racemase family PLP-dependent enzyme [Defluviitaleaceae bacterium]
MNPRLVIDLKKLAHNGRFLADLCHGHGMSMAAVTKVFCAEPPMVEALAAAGVDFLADSRVENIAAYPAAGQKTMMLRLVSPSEAENVVRHCDMSLNSEIAALEALATAAQKQGKTHKIILMIDLGDLREGVYFDNAERISRTVEFVLSQKSLVLEGIGTNLTCYGSVLPTADNLGQLCAIADGIRQKYGVALPMVSGGNSSTLYLLEKGLIPKGINNLRLGESIVCGKETAYGETFPGLEVDAVTLEAEIIEIAEKPSYPVGQININAFGETVAYDDIGVHKRAILAVGRQDTNQDGLACLTPGVDVIGASSDHLIVDISNAAPLAVGDRLSFSLSYGAVLAGFTSKYVDKVFV